MQIDIEAIKMAIVRLCDEKGISVNRLSELAGLRQSTVSSIMNGRSRNPTFKTLEKIAKGFDVDFDKFMHMILSSQDEITPGILDGPYPHGNEAQREIYERVRGVRLSKKLSLWNVCEATGLNIYYENQVADSFEALVRLCQFFNVSADYLLGLSDNPEPR